LSALDADAPEVGQRKHQGHSYGWPVLSHAHSSLSSMVFLRVHFELELLFIAILSFLTADSRCKEQLCLRKLNIERMSDRDKANPPWFCIYE
jgi:hypothetical protein